jgi:hypothetical protein
VGHNRDQSPGCQPIPIRSNNRSDSCRSSSACVVLRLGCDLAGKARPIHIGPELILPNALSFSFCWDVRGNGWNSIIEGPRFCKPR